MDEALLAAFVLALGKVNGGVRQSFHLEGHGRELPFDDVDVSRTVGWFTAIYPVLLSAPPSGGIRETLVAPRSRSTGT